MSIPTAAKGRRIHAWLASNPAATSTQVATAMDMPSKNACAILSELEREGFVTTERIYSELAKRHVRTYKAVAAAQEITNV